MISSDGITRDISAEEAVPWQPRPLDELNGGAAPTLEERLESARKEGYQQGYSEAVAESKKIQTAQNERINELLRYLGQPLASVDETLKQSMLSLAAEMASRIVAREIGNDLDYYRTQLDQLSDTLPAQVKVTSLRLRPEKARELRLIRTTATDAEEALPEVVDDAELAGDVCLACWQDSAVDISLRGRLAVIVQSYCGDNTTEALAIQVSPEDAASTPGTAIPPNELSNTEVPDITEPDSTEPDLEKPDLPEPGQTDSGQTEPVQTEPGQTEQASTEQQSVDGGQVMNATGDSSEQIDGGRSEPAAHSESVSDDTTEEVETPDVESPDGAEPLSANHQ